MSYDLLTVANALASTLEAADVPARIFPTPPSTINPPAIVVEYPDSLILARVALGVDEATIPLLLASGLTDPTTLSNLLQSAGAAILADPTLAGEVKNATPAEARNFRVLNVAGSELLSAHLLITVVT